LSELSRLDRLRRFFANAALPEGVTVGIGDDAAVLAHGDAPLIWTIDAAVEGVHFRRDWMSLEDVGYRSLMAATSDLAAMGAWPLGVLSALTLPAAFSDEELDQLARGQADAAAALGTAVIGGNLARGTELSVTTTALGAARKPLLRSGAAPGDVVAIAGRLGLARAGIEALQRGVAGAPIAPAIDAYRRPRALIQEGAAASASARAAIDVSDGLALDAARLADESGIRILLEADKVRAAGGTALAMAASALAMDALTLALQGGDDYALLMAFPPGALVAPFTVIGLCTRGAGVFLQDAQGTVRELAPAGYDHFQR
jgi:thiamine-monophosphate kinase